MWRMSPATVSPAVWPAASATAGKRVHVRADEDAVDVIDEVLWDYPRDQFLPHVRFAPEADRPLEPVVVGTAADTPAHRDVLINLNRWHSGLFRGFERVCEVLLSPPTRQGRANTANTANAGILCVHHELDDGNEPKPRESPAWSPPALRTGRPRMSPEALSTRPPSKPPSTPSGSAKAVSRQPATAHRMCIAISAAERHRSTAHLPCLPAHADGRAHPLPPHGRPPHVVANRHRPRADRHPDGGGTPASGAGNTPRGTRPRRLCRQGVGVEARHRRRHLRADPAHGLVGGLGARALHDGRGVLARPSSRCSCGSTTRASFTAASVS